MATYSVEELNWKCIVCGATNNMGPCPNCGNRTYKYWYLECTKCGHKRFDPILDDDDDNTWLKCAKCGKLTPRSKSGLKSKGCFIATAAYGSPSAHEVEILRKYRDSYLQRYSLGRLIIRLYELFSPPFANWIAESSVRRQFVRKVIMPPLLRIARERINKEKGKSKAG